MEESSLDFSATRTGSAWRRRLGNVALIVVGVLVFEVSANPSLGVAVACLKFGWDEARDGLWLRRVDPNRGRGRACFWMYLAVGFLRSSMIAFLGAVAMGIVAGRFGAAWGWPKRLLVAQLLGALGVVVAGIALASATSLAAVVFALLTRAKIWVGPEARQARERGDWPPRIGPSHAARPNRARSALLITAAGVVLLTIVLLLVVLVAIAPLLQPIPPNVGGGVAVVLTFGFMLGGAVFSLVFRDVVEVRVLARNPAECWPEAGFALPGVPIASVDDLE